jgi:hypothetical protein
VSLNWSTTKNASFILDPAGNADAVDYVDYAVNFLWLIGSLLVFFSCRRCSKDSASW